MKIHLIVTLILITSSLWAARSPEERKKLFQEATQELKATGIEKKIPKVGDTFPNLKLAGKTIEAWLEDGPLVVTFYRGGWCPYCVKQLKEINQGISQNKDLKASFIAIAPEQESEVKKTKGKNNLTFPMVSDADNKIASQLGLVFEVDKEVVKEYKILGIDLEASQGNAKNQLPIPGTFVIKKDRKITFVFADADYTKRAKTEDVLNALKDR